MESLRLGEFSVTMKGPNTSEPANVAWGCHPWHHKEMMEKWWNMMIYLMMFKAHCPYLKTMFGKYRRCNYASISGMSTERQLSLWDGIITFSSLLDLKPPAAFGGTTLATTYGQMIKQHQDASGSGGSHIAAELLICHKHPGSLKPSSIGSSSSTETLTLRQSHLLTFPMVTVTSCPRVGNLIHPWVVGVKRNLQTSHVRLNPIRVLVWLNTAVLVWSLDQLGLVY